MKKMMRRSLSLLLCLVMLIGILPAGALSVLAAEDPVIVIAGSDFQNTDSNHDAGADQVVSILDQIQADGYTEADGFLFAGDYDYGYDDSDVGKATLQAAVLAEYPSLSTENMIWVEGNHDDPNKSSNDDLVANGTLSASGENDTENYGVYVINHRDYMWYNSDEATIKETAVALDTYLDAKVAEDYEKPVFVVSHLPLHYNMRTYNDGDGMYANYLFDVLNEAGAKGLNIIFMFGHNHSNGWDDYLGGAAIYLEKGDSINIAQSSKTSFDVETLNFTYMNAGYVAYYRNVNTGSETDLTMTVFEITDGNVMVKRYSESGIHDLKSVGVRNSYKSETAYDPDTTVYASPQSVTWTVTPAVPSVTKTDEATGVSVTAPGITGLDVAATAKTVAGYSAYMSYDIAPAGYTQGDEATVTVPVDTALFDSSRSVVVLDREKNTSAVVPIVDGTVTFVTNHFSAYDVMQTAETAQTGTVGNWVTITEPTTAGTRYVYELDTNGVDTGVEYLIVANSYAKALSAAASSNNAVDITLSSDGATAYTDSDTYGWTFTSYNNSSTVYYIRLNGSAYLRLNNGSLTSSTSTGNDRRWTVSGNNDGSYDITRSTTGSWGSTTTYNLRWSNSNGVFQASSSNEGPVRLYKYSKTETTEASAGIKGRIVGTTEYTFMTNTSEAVIKEAVMAGVDGQWAWDTDLNTVFPVADSDLVWTMDETYDGSAGEYELTVAYNGIEVGKVKITIVSKIATSIVVDPMNGKVQRGSALSTETGSTMTVTYNDGSVEENVPVTVAMLSTGYDLSKNGTYSGLTVSYAGASVSGYTLQVVNVAGNDFPTYPNAGSVDVEKSATGIDFQNTGLTQVKLSTSGLPAGQGADVVIVIDTSSSMKDNDVGSSGKTRIEVLSESLEDMLTQFQTANSTTGVVSDIDIAIIDFNGYFPSSAGDYDEISFTGSNRNNADYAKVFTGSNAGEYVKNITLSADDFVASTSVNAATVAGYFTNENCASGTNYDGALENAYKLLSAKKAANQAAGETRDQYVIFLSDGAPFRYNGANNGSTKSTYNAWSNWLTGYWANATALEAQYPNFDYGYFYNGNGSTHPHRIAEAIKGDESTKYDVVVRDAATNDPAYIAQYQGLGATIYSIGFGLADDGSDSEGGKVSVATQEELIRVISSGEGYYYENVQTADELTDAFTQIVTGIAYAAQDAVFQDQMGTAFDLQMNPTVKTNANGGGTTTVDTSITVTTYPIYTKKNAPTDEDVGKTYGAGTVEEKVSFTVDASGNIIATSTAKTETDGNILNDGVICAKNFFYNTTTVTKKIDVDGDGTAETDLAGETFYWNIGTINEKQFTLTYTVYLTGSMEGEALPSDSYETNNYATLSYTNWLGNEVSQSVPSPSMPWGGANVSYAFYLVDKDGNPLLANGTQAANFLEAYKVTQPVLYSTINLNAGETVLSAIAKNVLPVGYTLYDNTAVYTVNVASGTGSSNWNITYDASKVQSTYVVGYAGTNDYTNATPVSNTSYDYTHTTVYFAVVWDIGTVPDTVVIDFGLPVDISVLANDMFGGNGTLAGVGLASDIPEGTYTANMDADFSGSANGTYGTAKIDGSEVTYTLNNSNGMQMKTAEELAYAVNYTGDTNSGYYYGEVTVIPATTVYYEDSFLTLEGSNTTWDKGYAPAASQDEDRPGEYSLSQIDANNIYGYDKAYLAMAEHSMGSAAKVTVDADSYATAKFSFYGTGFDVVSVTSNMTGVLWVKVYAAENIGDYAAGEQVKSAVVNTYYGYSQNEAGEWVTSVNDPNALYQVPVMQIEELAYGKYNVEITASYVSAMDKTTAAGYDLYLDAIRIYNPAGTTYDVKDADGNVVTEGNIQDVIQNAYIEDGEAWPTYTELRNNVIAAASYAVTENADGSVTVTGNKINGLIFIDSDDSTDVIADYVSYGPNNELYLANGQTIAFNVALNPNVADVQLGIKVANGNTVTYTINGDEKIINSATDMYYSILSYAKSGLVTIHNSSGGILSLTNIKVTYTQDPNGVSPASLLWMDGESAGYALMSLRAPVVEEEIPEVTEPEVTEPEVTEPETTVPEETEPETTVPEETEPEATEPEVSEPEDTEEDTVTTIINKVKEKVTKAISWLFGWLRG